MQTSRKPKATRRLRELHRWLGVAAAAFLLLLCVTGVALNHSATLGLDGRYITQGWLLDRYGIRAPSLGPSYEAGARRITLADGRLYLDAQEVVAGVPDLVGAVELEGRIAAATSDELFIFDQAGDLTERWPLDVQNSRVAAIAPDEGGILLATQAGPHRFDWVSTTVTRAEPGTREPAWSEASVPDAELTAAIERGYRGRGLTFERVLLDLHSGRLVGLSGVLVMDLAALALCFLAVTGIVIWWRR